jgi:hypothetical protein
MPSNLFDIIYPNERINSGIHYVLKSPYNGINGISNLIKRKVLLSIESYIPIIICAIDVTKLKVKIAMKYYLKPYLQKFGGTIPINLRIRGFNIQSDFIETLNNDMKIELLAEKPGYGSHIIDISGMLDLINILYENLKGEFIDARVYPLHSNNCSATYTCTLTIYENVSIVHYLSINKRKCNINKIFRKINRLLKFIKSNDGTSALHQIKSMNAFLETGAFAIHSYIMSINKLIDK